MCAAIALKFGLDAIDGGTGCGGELPAPVPGEPLDPRFVNLSYSDGNTRQILVYVGSEDACGTELGWYYDNAAAPTRILACPETCTAVQSSTAAKVEVLLGCATEPATVR